MNVFRGGLVFKAHRLLYHSSLGLRVIKKKQKDLDDLDALDVRVHLEDGRLRTWVPRS